MDQNRMTSFLGHGPAPHVTSQLGSPCWKKKSETKDKHIPVIKRCETRRRHWRRCQRICGVAGAGASCKHDHVTHGCSTSLALTLKTLVGAYLITVDPSCVGPCSPCFMAIGRCVNIQMLSQVRRPSSLNEFIFCFLCQLWQGWRPNGGKPVVFCRWNKLLSLIQPSSVITSQYNVITHQPLCVVETRHVYTFGLCIFPLYSQQLEPVVVSEAFHCPVFANL